MNEDTANFIFHTISYKLSLIVSCTLFDWIPMIWRYSIKLNDRTPAEGNLINLTTISHRIPFVYLPVSFDDVILVAAVDTAFYHVQVRSKQTNNTKTAFYRNKNKKQEVIRWSFLLVFVGKMERGGSSLWLKVFQDEQKRNSCAAHWILGLPHLRWWHLLLDRKFLTFVVQWRWDSIFIGCFCLSLPDSLRFSAIFFKFYKDLWNILWSYQGLSNVLKDSWIFSLNLLVLRLHGSLAIFEIWNMKYEIDNWPSWIKCDWNLESIKSMLCNVERPLLNFK